MSLNRTRRNWNTKEAIENLNALVLLIAPEGIEILLILTIYYKVVLLLIAPEGIEISYQPIACFFVKYS